MVDSPKPIIQNVGSVYKLTWGSENLAVEIKNIQENNGGFYAETYIKYVSQVHADPWRFIKEEEFIQKAEEIKKRIRESKEAALPLFDCFFYLDELAAAIKDGHTMIVLPVQQFTGTEPVFPFDLRVIDDKVFVVKKWKGDSLPLYGQVLGINQTTMETYREKFNRLANTHLQHVRDLMFELAFGLMLGLRFNGGSRIERPHRQSNPEHRLESIRADSGFLLRRRELRRRAPH
jgi:hypothetical protein